ncbi:MAG: retroviral-like aspartic protease family protein [Pseudomonadota bacterium]|nr:retroviral-like aspartic protease family protein [Pseudomonadota bacterium]
MRKILSRALLVLLLLGAIPASACVVRSRASVPLDVTPRGIFVAVAVNGQPASFLLDTDAARSLVTPEAVRRLGLRLDQWVASTMVGVGGLDRHSVADPTSLTLAGIALRRHTLAADNTLAVAVMPFAENGGRRIDGLLGRDFLSAFDVALDGPARTMTLYNVAGCDARFRPWSGHSAAITALPAYGDALVIPVQVDERPLRALPDTGAASSVVVAPGMVRLGLKPGSSGDRVRIHGVGVFVRGAEARRVASLRVGDDTTTDPVLLAAPVEVTPIVDMLLGADWLARRRVWLSYATRQVFVAAPK